MQFDCLGGLPLPEASCCQRLACSRHPPMPPTHPCSHPQERANLAEQTLRQREGVLAEKERFQSEVQHLSQGLQQLARETSTAVAADGKLAEQLAAAQAQLFAEKQRRADAECEAQVNGGGGRRRWTADGGGVWDAASDHTVSNGQYRPDVPALPLIPCPPAARVRPPTNTPRLAPAGAQGAR